MPIADTLIAMVRRFINGQSMVSPDSSHLHHRLVKSGLSHRQTVLFIYALSAMFSLAAIMFSMTTMWGSALIFSISILVLQVLIESLGLINENYKPLINFVKAIRQKY